MTSLPAVFSSPMMPEAHTGPLDKASMYHDYPKKVDATDEPSTHPVRVLAKVGEIALKGRNRPRFYAQLTRNLRAGLKGLKGVQLLESGSVLVIGVPNDEVVRDVCARIDRVFGIAAYSVVSRCHRDVEDIAEAALHLIHDKTPTSFAVRAKRRDKSFKLTSVDLEREVGAAIQARIDLPVDLTTPDLTVRVELDPRWAYVAAEQLRGPGGLPVGSTGSALTLLSGGIDSPIAALYAMKRGLAIEYIHFSGAPYVNAETVNKAFALAKVLNGFYPHKPGRLWVVTFGNHQRRLANVIAPEHRIVLYRRQMIRVAEFLAHRIGADSLVTGDSLGQVSSQTLPNLHAIDLVARLPLLRPLLAMDKREVMERAASLGILRLSEQRAADACPLFADMPQHTRVPVAALEAAERRADAVAIAEEAASQAKALEPDPFMGTLEPDSRAAQGDTLRPF